MCFLLSNFHCPTKHSANLIMQPSSREFGAARHRVGEPEGGFAEPDNEPDQINTCLVGQTFELQGMAGRADCTVRWLGLSVSVGKVGVETVPDGTKMVVPPGYLNAPAACPEKILAALSRVKKLCSDGQTEVECEPLPAPTRPIAAVPFSDAPLRRADEINYMDTKI